MSDSFEWAYARARVLSKFKPRIEVLPYVPKRRERPERYLGISSAWAGLENVFADLIDTFHISTNSYLEFGVEHGFSAIAASSYFSSVTGVDTFQGDRHTNLLQDSYPVASANIAPYNNIKLVRSDYRDYIRTVDQSVKYDLSHVDIIHTFADTYACGLWAAQHSTCTIFHDTESFPAVKMACREIARTTGKKFYNFTEFYGLGVVV